jgi:hypothetical protein
LGVKAAGTCLKQRNEHSFFSSWPQHCFRQLKYAAGNNIQGEGEKFELFHFKALQDDLRKISQNEIKQKRHRGKDKATLGGVDGIAM